jgi:hypothetical protein
MQTLRNAKTLARFALVWFALFLGVATAAPFVSPQTTQVICSVDGTTKVVVANAGLNESDSGHHLKCPLCTGVGALPPLELVLFDAVKTSAYLPRSIDAARIASKAGATLPPRGPPTFL